MDSIYFFVLSLNWIKLCQHSLQQYFIILRFPSEKGKVVDNEALLPAYLTLFNHLNYVEGIQVMSQYTQVCKQGELTENYTESSNDDTAQKPK